MITAIYERHGVPRLRQNNSRKATSWYERHDSSCCIESGHMAPKILLFLFGAEDARYIGAK